MVYSIECGNFFVTWVSLLLQILNAPLSNSRKDYNFILTQKNLDKSNMKCSNERIASFN